MSQDDMSPEEIAQMQKEQCIFCKIISGQIPCNKVYEDDEALCILDINPANEGHLLLLPKEHYQIMPQIPQEELSGLFVKSKKLSNALLQSFQTGGTSVFVANGGVAGQRAPHFMIHIIPRRSDDGIFMIPRKGSDSNKLVQIQQALIANLSKAFGRPVVDQKKKPEKTSDNKENKPKKPDPERSSGDSSKGNIDDTDLDKISGMFLK